MSEHLGLEAECANEIIDTLLVKFKEEYFYPNVAEKACAKIEEKRKNGKYEILKNLDELCEMLTKDLRSENGDKHICVFESREEAEFALALLPSASEEVKAKIREKIELNESIRHFGFQKMEILEGDIGYLKYDYFCSSNLAFETTTAVFNVLSNAKAIILDLRDNGGGSEEMVVLISSLLMCNERTELNGVLRRKSDVIERRWTLQQDRSCNLGSIPVYLLTSSKTFSAAEDLCYGLQSIGRAVIIGERTGGGAHPCELFVLKDPIVAQIPNACSLNPVTGTNWEGTGVLPDYLVESAKALKFAIKKFKHDSGARVVEEWIT